MEEEEDQPPVYIPHMPCMSDQRVKIEVAYYLCSIITSHKVVPTPVRDILWAQDLSTIWRSLPRDMTLLMCHIFEATNLIETFMGVSHDPTPSSSLIEPSTSSNP
jgi:hypothetical protein